MSRVTSYILVVSCGDGPAMWDAVNRTLASDGTPSRFVPVDEHVVGPKQMEVDVLVAAFNYMDGDKLVDMIESSARSLGKRDGLFSCQLLTCSEGEDFFVETLRFAPDWRPADSESR